MRHSPYDIIDRSIGVQTIRRQVERFAAEFRIDLRCMETMELRHFMEEASRQMVLQFTAKCASKKFQTMTVRHPADWWQSAKYAFTGWKRCPGRLARWIVKKWPVRFTEHTMEASAYHPEVEIPNQQTFVEIRHMARMQMNPWDD